MKRVKLDHQWLSNIVKESNLSQKDFAEKIGVEASVLSHWLSGSIKTIKDSQRDIIKKISHETAQSHETVEYWDVDPIYIRSLIAKLQITQKQFADKIGVDPNKISKWLNGKLKRTVAKNYLKMKKLEDDLNHKEASESIGKTEVVEKQKVVDQPRLKRVFSENDLIGLYLRSPDNYIPLSDPVDTDFITLVSTVFELGFIPDDYKEHYSSLNSESFEVLEAIRYLRSGDLSEAVDKANDIVLASQTDWAFIAAVYIKIYANFTAANLESALDDISFLEKSVSKVDISFKRDVKASVAMIKLAIRLLLGEEAYPVINEARNMIRSQECKGVVARLSLLDFLSDVALEKINGIEVVNEYRKISYFYSKLPKFYAHELLALMEIINKPTDRDERKSS